MMGRSFPSQHAIPGADECRGRQHAQKMGLRRMPVLADDAALCACRVEGAERLNRHDDDAVEAGDHEFPSIGVSRG